MRNKRIRLPLAVVGIAALIVCAWLLSGRVRSQGQVTLATWTEPALPDTAAGNQLEAYMGVLNVGDRARLEEFVREYFSPVGPGGGDINDRIKSQVRFYNTASALLQYRTGPQSLSGDGIKRDGYHCGGPVASDQGMATDHFNGRRECAPPN